MTPGRRPIKARGRAAPHEASEDESLERLLSLWLRAGTVLVIAALAGAFLWAALSGSYPSMKAAWSPGWTHFGPTSLVLVGALLLAILPPARVVIAGVVFARSRDWRYLIFSAVALGFVAASNVLGTLLRKG
jgi:uncharacterized membrane protein